MIHFDRMRSSSCPSGYQLDKLLAGEASALADVRRHLDGCPPCAARLEEMKRLRADFRAAPPRLDRRANRRRARPPQFAAPGWSADHVLRDKGTGPPVAALIPRVPSADLRASGRRRRIAGGVAAGLAAVTTLLFSAVPRTDPGDGDGGSDVAAGVRRKGPAVLVLFYVEHRGEVRAGGRGEVVHPGDALQFAYTSDGAGYLAIVSRDGAGNGSIYVADRDRAAAIAPGADVSLPTSVRLDGVLGRETIYAVSCDRPVEVEPLRQAVADRAAAPPTPPGCRVESFAIDKRAP